MGMNTLSTHDKALRINIDAARYGTFAEIGAGQEVARWFFHVGGAAGTVAKTISAYDMAVSRRGLRPGERYVAGSGCNRCSTTSGRCSWSGWTATRGGATKFFVFADTVTREKLFPQGGGPRLAGHPVPDGAARAALGDHHPRAHVGQGKRPPAGGAGDPGGEPHPRRVLRSRAARGAHRRADGRADPRPHGSGHDQVFRPGLRRARQPPHEPPARAAAADQRRRCSPPTARWWSLPSCSTTHPCSSSAGASAPSRG